MGCDYALSTELGTTVAAPTVRWNMLSTTR
jgi:hypothetical protein